MIIHILISILSLFVIILFGISLIIVLGFILKMIHTCVCACVCVSSFWGQSNGDSPVFWRSSVFLPSRESWVGIYLFSWFLTELVPVSWRKVVSKTAGTVMKLAGRSGGFDPVVPNVPWHVRWKAGWWEVGIGRGRQHRMGWKQRRSAVSSVQSGCQMNCHVSHRDWLLWASGCFGVYIKRTGCEHENSARPPPPSNQSLAFPALLSLALRLSFLSFPHERSTSKVLRSVCAQEGRRHACRNATVVHDRLRELPERWMGRRKVATSLKDTSPTLLPEMTADHGVASRAEHPGKPHTSLSLDHNTQEMYHLLPFSPPSRWGCFPLSENTFAWILQTVDNHTSLALMRFSWLCFQASPAFSSFVGSPKCNCILGPCGTSAPSHRCVAITLRVIRFQNKWIQVWFLPYIPFSISFFRHVLFSWQGLAAT